MSSIGASGIGVFQQFQSIFSANRAQGGPQPPQAQAIRSEIQSAAQSAGLDADKVSGLKSQIKDTVSSIIQQGGDRSEVRSAVNSLLQDSGIDTQALQQQLSGIAQPLQGYGRFGQQTQDGLASFFNDAPASSSSQLLELLDSLPSGSLVDQSA